MMKQTRLSAYEIASNPRAKPSSEPKRDKAGALRSLESDRGLHGGLVSQPYVGFSDRTGLIFAIGFAFSAFSIGIFFLVLSAPYIWDAFKLVGKLLR